MENIAKIRSNFINKKWTIIKKCIKLQLIYKEAAGKKFKNLEMIDNKNTNFSHNRNNNNYSNNNWTNNNNNNGNNENNENNKIILTNTSTVQRIIITLIRLIKNNN